MERIKLNLIPSGVAPVVHVSQYDDGRNFGIDLFEGESVYVLDGTETLTVNVRKPDGHIVTEGVTNTGTSSLTVTTTEQMTAVKGTNLANLKIEKGSVTIATLNFLMAVEVDPLENGDPSESFIHNLETQIAQAVSEQYDSANVVFDPAPTTGHGTGFAVTSEGVKDYVDNAIGGLSIPEELNDLSDVNITSPTQGEALVFDADGNIVNGTVSTVGNLDDLSDVDTTGKAEGDSLRYIGGEWKAKPTTVEMTQAEYDAIVDFTEYANTHIVITDAPNLNATASDIEYSSGVTVADMLDCVDVSSDITRNTTNVSSTDYSINCYTVGKMAYLIITNFQTATAWSGDRVIATGLPKPKTDFNFVGSLYNSNGGSNVRLRVKSNGDLYSWFNNIASGSNVFGCIAYPIA